MQSAVRTHSDSGFSESELRLRQTSLLLQTHLLRLHSLSQLLKIFLSMLDSLLECLLRLLQLVLEDKQKIVNVSEVKFTLTLDFSSHNPFHSDYAQGCSQSHSLHKPWTSSLSLPNIVCAYHYVSDSNVTEPSPSFVLSS